jgi:outer membrane protein assembly factor BamC
LGKLLNSLYSTGERDKFRTRLERNTQGGTDVFISHRGMVEVYGDTHKEQTVWQPRLADPELEAEFLRRLMVKLGVSQEQSNTLLAAGVVDNSVRQRVVNGLTVLELDDGFDRAWRRVGLSLDRTSFTVEDRDRTRGIYFVRYVAPVADKAEGGFFSNLFRSSKPEPTPQKFRITIESKGDISTVSVQNAEGFPADEADVQRMMKLLADDLK